MATAIVRRSSNHFDTNKSNSADSITSTSSGQQQEERINLLTTVAAEKMKIRLNLLGRSRKRLLRWVLNCAAFVTGVVFMFVPLLVFLFPGLQKMFIFLTFVNQPWLFDFNEPEKVGLKATRNFYIDTADSIKLGAWHILPKSLQDTDDHSSTYYELSLRKGQPVILYMHGNSGSRASGHRVELYNVLAELDAHVIAFDYRGYGDSTKVGPSENGIVRDAKAVYQWLRQRVGSSPIYVWGHSLGTGVATRAVSELCQEGEPPHGLVLEAPFNNMSEEILMHPLASIFKLAPWFRWAMMSALKSNKIFFDSDKHICGITIPILILHAEDDNIIPVKLAVKLHHAASVGRPKTSPPASLILFNKMYKYGHRYLCRAPELPDYIRNFLDRPEIKLS